MAILGVNQLTAMETTPLEFVDIAAQAGVDEISFFVNSMGPQSRFPLVTRDLLAEVKARVAEHGLRVANCDPFTIAPQVDVANYTAAIELAAELGARSVNALLFDDDEARVVDALGRLCEQAHQHGLRTGIEFMPLTPKWQTLEEAAQLVDQVGQDNLTLGLDVLHLIRSGGRAANVAALDPGKIGYVQLCDGADLTVTRDYGEEAGTHRLVPGEGVFPLQDIIRAVPADICFELEVPQSPDRPALERLTHAVTATRALLAEAGR